jgi:hypothetical protein
MDIIQKLDEKIELYQNETKKERFIREELLKDEIRALKKATKIPFVTACQDTGVDYGYFRHRMYKKVGNSEQKLKIILDYYKKELEINKTLLYNSNNGR